MREKLPPRRLGITERLTFRPGTAGEVTFDVTFGYEPGGPVREAFCQAFRVGTDMQNLLHQGCIFISAALQCGQSMADLARIAGEDNPSSAAQSHLGLIVRAGVVLDDWLTAQHALVRGPMPVLPDLPSIDAETIFDDTNDDELDEGLSASDLAEEDGGTLVAMAECQNVAVPASILDHMSPEQINGMRNSRIPEPATEAAAVVVLKTFKANDVPVVAFQDNDAEAGLTCSGGTASATHDNAIIVSANVSAGVTGGESAAPIDLARDMPAFLRRSNDEARA